MISKLSKRLQMIAHHVPPGTVFADIGTDHAMLPVYLASQGIIRYGLAGEVNPGPLEAAKRQVFAAGLTHCIEVREGDGLAILQEDEVDVVTIAGMGGQLIAGILASGQARLAHVKKLILQPNVGEEAVRRWLVEAGWVLTSETILEEDHHVYEILVAERLPHADERNNRLYHDRQIGQGPLQADYIIDTSMLYLLGPYLTAEADSLWVGKWRSECAQLRMILEQLRMSQSDEARQRSATIKQQLEAIEEVLTCMQKVKQLANGSNN